MFKMFFTDTLGIDRDVFWSLTNKFWWSLKGPLSIVFIVMFLTPEEQGIWYTFGNLAALTVFAELGFTLLITQFVSHEYAKLKVIDGVIVGDEHYVDRLISLVRFAIKFYLLVIPIAIVILTGVGIYFFRSHAVEIMIAWFLFSIVGGVNLLVSLLQSIYQGLDRVEEVQKNILMGSVVITLMNWGLLAAGIDIWALVVGNGIGVVVMLFHLFKKSSKFWFQLLRHRPKQKFSWITEIVRVQFKYALSWISGYFMLNLIVPAVYKFEGAVLAGRLGLTVSIIRALMMTSSSWLSARIPKFNMLVSNNRRREMYTLFKSSFFQGYGFYILGSSMLVAVVYFMNKYNFFNDRLLSTRLLTLYLVSETAELFLWFLAVYLRAHKDEPLYRLNIALGILIGAAIVFILPVYGLEELLITLIAIKWIIGIPFSIIVYKRFKKNYEGKTSDIT